MTSLMDRARQGDALAIADLLTQSMVRQGIVARGYWLGVQLCLELEAPTPIPQESVVPRIQRGLQRLNLTCPVETVWVSGWRVGTATATWQASFEVGVEGPSATAALSPDLPDPDVQGAPLSDTTLTALVHLVPLVSYLVIGGQWLGGWPLFWGGSFLLPWRVAAPLVMLVVRGGAPDAISRPTDVQHQAKAALNFQLTMVIAWVVTIALMFILVGFLLVIPLALVEMVNCIIAGVQAAEGKPARYLVAIRFVR